MLGRKEAPVLENEGSRVGSTERMSTNMGDMNGPDVATRDSKSSVNSEESQDANPRLQSATDSRRANFMAASVTSPKLYHTSSIQEGGELEECSNTPASFDRNTSGSAQNDDRVARLPSLDFSDGRAPSFKLGVDRSVPADPGPIGAPASLQGWNSDLLDLPVGQGGPPNKRKLCVLSLDGGGMRGLIAARILSHLEKILQTICEPEDHDSLGEFVYTARENSFTICNCWM
ncbi:hypothetical protein KC19_5G004700 [Ceratodon purpureus]|uniref:PNPLA domain-containing protein n=1 Tax=Ceratodon purpureus TaxID=3225 RepID=A0A8T0HYM1_CERPU|nr:hypothetical protein KC19_5G004700 [Ceratodon purpureus]